MSHDVSDEEDQNVFIYKQGYQEYPASDNDLRQSEKSLESQELIITQLAVEGGTVQVKSKEYYNRRYQMLLESNLSCQ